MFQSLLPSKFPNDWYSWGGSVGTDAALPTTIITFLGAAGMFAFEPATLATFFVGRDAENPDAEVAGAKAIAELQAEIAALRTDLQMLLKQKQEK